MAIREDLVASAVAFLQDPTVASSPAESRISFLQAKNLTQEEINAALARAGQGPPGGSPGGPPVPYASGPPSVSPQQQQQPSYYGQYSPYTWQPAPPEPPRRDWRDWFIMATVVGGVGYGAYTLTKRYIYPLIAPPTPERLEQDKKSIDDQFEKAFTLVEQLAKDTEALKAAEEERTERLDKALEELESVMGDLRSANRRREEETQRVRSDVQGLKDSLPKAMDAQKEATDSRLREVNAELRSLKTLIAQRMNPPVTASNPLRATNGNPGPASPAPTATPAAGSENTAPQMQGDKADDSDDAKRQNYQDYISGLNRSSPFGTGQPASQKASIPAWQLARASKGSGSTSAAGGDATSNTQVDVGSGS